MAYRYCLRCAKQVDGVAKYCDECALLAGSATDRARSRAGCGMALTGCALPFVFGGGALLLIGLASNGIVSGIVAVTPFFVGLVVGIPLVIAGLVKGSQTPNLKNEDIPPPVL